MQTQTRPSGTKTATCGGLRRTSGRIPNPDRFGRTTKCHAGKPAKPTVHGRRETLPGVMSGAGYIPDKQMRVPVVDTTGRPLMPCTPKKARKLLNGGQASACRDKLGIFYIQLKKEIAKPSKQVLVLGIDPGSKFEGYTVLGTKDTVLNLEAEAPDWVKKSVETRREMRRARRFRNTRRRECRVENRLAGKVWLPPSTKSRWDAKVRIAKELKKVLPFETVVVEDVMATTKKGKRWNQAFSPIQMGKEHMYRELGAMGLKVVKKKGTETKELRDTLGLRKTTNKSKEVFETHCVDSWVLAAFETGAKVPSTKRIYYIVPLQFHRRQLHRFKPAKGGIRAPYGGTRSLGVKRGTIVRHKKFGVCYVGGAMGDRISLHARATGKRLTQGAKVTDCHILTTSSWRTRLPPRPEVRGFRREVIL